jgi:hypothetical protein
MPAPKSDQTLLVFADPFPVPCASDFIEDQFGVSMVVRVGTEQQVFRWIAPGRFLMGSPADEAERGRTETLHEVTLSQRLLARRHRLHAGLLAGGMAGQSQPFSGRLAESGRKRRLA